MAFNDLDRIYCFSLGDFHNFEKCYFNFLVKHHLQKRYEIEEGNKNQAIGNLLDLVMKIIHRAKAYNQPLDYILNAIFKAAENEMRDKVERAGARSFYGATIPFLTEETKTLAKEVFKRYYESRKGKINKVVLNEKFWECMLEGEKSPVDSSSVHKIARMTVVKEKHAEIVEEEIVTLWADYFKEEHFSQNPELKSLIEKTIKLTGKARQEVNPEVAQELLGNVQKIAEIFWKTKGFESIRIPSGYPTEGEIVSHK